MSFNNGFYSNDGYQGYPQQRSMSRPQMQPNAPIREIKFVTSEEARAYIVMPNTSSMLIDQEQGLVHIKSANSMGQSFIRTFSYTEYVPTPDKTSTPNIDYENLIYKKDLTEILDRLGSLEQIISRPAPAPVPAPVKE